MEFACFPISPTWPRHLTRIAVLMVVVQVVLETEITNKGALALYERLDFIRDKRLHAYYMNGVDAFRLKLWLTPSPEAQVQPLMS